MYGRLRIIWADGGYLGRLIGWVKQLKPFGKLRLEIIRRCDQVRGFQILPKRWIIERTFGWFCKSRRLCRDYEVLRDQQRGNDSNLHDPDHGQALGSYMIPLSKHVRGSKALREDSEAVVDITGGKKIMTAAAAHGPGQSPRCAVRDEVGKRPMTSWPYGLLRPAGSGGRVSR
jgi:hypothetical protein